MSTVDEVKTRLDIVDVIGGYVRLQKSGRYFKAPCPFHNEKTPSFIVNPERQSWHCFGACGTGGDVFSFVAKKENLDFGDTLRLLAERAGVELRSDGRRREEIKTLQDANEAAALFSHGLLQNAPPAARAYIDERGLDKQAVSDFQLGYAPPGWDYLRDHLKGKGFAEAQLIEVGLCIEGERGAYDRFRDRLIFPIRDERGRVVGFGGRVLPKPEGLGGVDGTDTGPKYVNTPQSPIFDKGGVLYGLDRAKEEIRKVGTAVIVEGYMDVIAAHQHGFRNVVASMGTALTEKQATLLQRFAGRVVLAMDADEAGSAANLRAVQVVAAAAERPARGENRARSLDIRVNALPQGKDPDELIRSDPGAWTSAVEAAKPVIDHLLAVTSAALDLAQPRDRSQLVNEVLPVIGEVNDPVLQAHYLQRLSRMARVSEEALRQQLPRRGRRHQREPEANEALIAGRRVVSAPIEEFALALLYTFESLAPLADRLDDEMFGLSENRELFRKWRAGEPVTEDETELYEHYQDVLRTRVPVSEMTQVEVAFLDCVERLRQVRMRAVKEASALALAEGEAGVRPGQVASIAVAKMGAGESEEAHDDEASSAASRLLEDMEAGLQFHRRLIEGSAPNQTGEGSTL
ncbi:MAG TPA: DNA primase [Dehalococcoidia bacterium]|nr:DNA primase [Dehalococcoidia bacterium]